MTIKLVAPGSIQLPHWGTPPVHEPVWTLWTPDDDVNDDIHGDSWWQCWYDYDFDNDDDDIGLWTEHLLEFLVGIVDDKLFEAVRLEGLETVQV